MPTDLYWTLDDDYALGIDGDLFDTSFDLFRSRFQEVRTRVKAQNGDWAEHPNLAANLHELLGEVNNRFTAEEGRTRIIGVLTMGGFVNSSSLNVRYVPVGKQTILYLISMVVINPTTGETQLLKTTLTYDTNEGRITVV